MNNLTGRVRRKDEFEKGPEGLVGDRTDELKTRVASFKRKIDKLVADLPVKTRRRRNQVSYRS